MLNFKKPHTWVAVFVVAVIVIVAANFLTNQKTVEGKDSISDTTNTQIENAEVESTEVPVADNAIDEKTKQSILDWAQAFAKRDGDKIVEMATKDAQKTLENENLLQTGKQDGKTFHSFGWSSPWPGAVNNTSLPPYMLYSTDVKNQTADILYYAEVSDPHVTMWKETIHYAWENEKFQVTEEALKIYDSITSGKEFDIAYLGGFHDTLMDYTANGLGEAANENAGRSDGYDPEHEYNLYDAIEAAHYFLNIPNDETKIRMNVVPTQNKKRVVIRITFLTDGGQRIIEMVQSWGENGIWVPQNHLDSETDTAEILKKADGNASSDVSSTEEKTTEVPTGME